MPTSWSSAAIRIRSISASGSCELAGHRDDDRGDQRRRLAAVVGERRDDRRRATSVAASRASRPISIARGAARRRDRRARDAGVLVGLGEDVGLVAAERLGRVHRRVGVADERLDRGAAGPTPPAMPIEIVTDRPGLPSTANRSRSTSSAQLLGEDRAFLDVRLGQDQHELLAAVAADQVGRAQVGGERLGDAAQDDVAGRVAVRVVDGLEVVDVDEGDRQRAARSGSARSTSVKQRGQQRLAVGDAGQAVDRRPVVGVGQRRRRSR